MVASAIPIELIESAVGGDKAAIDALLRMAQPDIRRYAIFHCLNREDAEDATQDTLWQLYRRIGTLRAVAALPAWLMTVVRRACDRMTGRPHHGHLLEDTVIVRRPDVELRMDVAAAIESLPEHYRTVVVLRDFRELKIDEIGAELGLTREAVKGRLHRARELVREYLLQ